MKQTINHWKNFFNDSNNNILSYSNTIQMNISDTDSDILLINQFSYKGKPINIYLSTTKNIDLYSLEILCDAVGWIRRPFHKVKTAITNSFLIISVFYRHSNNKNTIVGFARATSDHAFNATIWDVVIHPDFQRKGLGKLLIYKLIQQLRSADITTITLFADPQVISFYKNLGFIIDPDGVKGMFWYPR